MIAKLKLFIVWLFGKLFIGFLKLMDKLTPSKNKAPQLLALKENTGISVIIPERDSVEMLGNCLNNLYQSLSVLGVTNEVIVVANGSQRKNYKNLIKRYNKVIWHFDTKPYGFAQAIETGLKLSQYAWVYLLNNDMRLTPNALKEVWVWRSNKVFALASQIFFEDKNKRREETGYTGFHKDQGTQGLYDKIPEHSSWVAQQLYAGGGASLFNSTYLSDFIKESQAYHPFYWEDVEWGLRAQQSGLSVLFIPTSHVYHQHRATVSRFYSEQEIQHMFKKNGIQSSLRNNLANLNGTQIELLYHYKIVNLSNLLKIIKSRFYCARSHFIPQYFGDDVLSFYPRNFNVSKDKPWIIWVTPFSICPLSHGGARRIISITKTLSQFYKIALLSDEGWAYDLKNSEALNHFHKIDLILPIRKETSNKRIDRITSHSRKLLSKQLDLLIEKLNPKIIQIEHEELCDLIKHEKQNNWFLTLHDVNHSNSKDDDWVNQRLEKYQSIVCCSQEDKELLNPLNSGIIENGANLKSCGNYKVSSGYNILFIGPFRYTPNLNGIIEFVENNFLALKQKFPKLQLTILTGVGGLEIANKYKCLNQKDINLIDFTDNVNHYIKQSTLTINPLQDIRGSSIKTIESLALGRICVSSKSAARGLLSDDFKGLKIANKPIEWQLIIGALLNHPKQRHKSETLEVDKLTKYNWQNSALKYREIYDR